MIAVLLLAALYFLPAIVARNHQNVSAIFVLNLLLGWTFVGWVVALVWANTDPGVKPVRVPARIWESRAEYQARKAAIVKEQQLREWEPLIEAIRKGTQQPGG